MHSSTQSVLRKFSLLKADALDKNAKNIILNDLEELGITSKLRQLLWNLKGNIPGKKPWIEEIFESDDYLKQLKNKIAEPFLTQKTPILNPFLMKAWEFIKENKYPILLTTLLSYGIYDYYHDKHITSVKNNLFSLWKNIINESNDEDQSKDIGLAFTPY